MAICSNGASGHAVVVYGCGLVNGNQTLLVFDPHGTSTTGTFSVSYASPTFTSSINAIVCTWDYGYFSYCNKYEYEENYYRNFTIYVCSFNWL